MASDLPSLSSRFANLLRYLGIEECETCLGTGEHKNEYTYVCIACIGEGFIKVDKER